MEFWSEFLASSGGQEFVAGGIGGMAGIVAGHPLDTLKIRQQQPHLSPSSGPTSPMALLRHMVATEGPLSLFKGMSSPLATIAFQICANIIVARAILSAFCSFLQLKSQQNMISLAQSSTILCKEALLGRLIFENHEFFGKGLTKERHHLKVLHAEKHWLRSEHLQQLYSSRTRTIMLAYLKRTIYHRATEVRKKPMHGREREGGMAFTAAANKARLFRCAPYSATSFHTWDLHCHWCYNSIFV